jgi:nitroreductase
MIETLIRQNRSYRRFHQEVPVEYTVLRDLVNLARHSASSKNKQPLKYILSNEVNTNSLIFPTLMWAGYLTDWPGPSEGERPSAYIIILGDKGVAESFSCDHGIAAQSIMLGAVEKGLGGCIIASIDRKELSRALTLPSHFEILLALAIGKPKETVVIENVGPDGDIKYWRDSDGIHHVPKRLLEDLIIEIK